MCSGQRHLLTMNPTLLVGVIPFANAFAYVSCATMLFFSLFGLLFTSVVLFFNGKQLDTPTSLFIQSICFADWIFNLLVVIQNPWELVVGGFPWGPDACYLIYYVVMNAAGTSLLSLSSLAFERYLATNWRIQLNAWQTRLWLFLIWTYPVIGFASPFMLGIHDDLVSLTDDATSCNINWRPTGQVSTFLIQYVVVNLLILFAIIFFSYFNIYYRYRELSIASHREDNLDAQRIILRRCVILTVTFFSLWGPESIKIIYESSTKHSIGAYINSFSAICVTIYSTVDPIIITLLDPRLQKRLLDIPLMRRLFRNPRRIKNEALYKTNNVANKPAKNVQLIENTSATTFQVQSANALDTIQTAQSLN